MEAETLKVWVTASPTDGQANAAVVAVIAKKLGLAPSKLTIISGHTGRDKTIAIEGLSDAEALSKLAP